MGTEWHSDDLWAADAAHERAQTAQHQTPGRHLSRPVIALAGACAFVLITITVIAAVLLGNRTPEPPPTPPAPASLSRPAPPGWDSKFAWSTLIDAPVAGISVNADHIAYRADNVLTVVEATTGQTTFTTALDSMGAATDPKLTHAADTAVVYCTDGPMLMMWPLDAPDGTEPERLTLPADARVADQGGGLMAYTATEAWRVTAELTLEPVDVPRGDLTMGVGVDGAAITAPERGSWSVITADGKRQKVALSAPPEGAEGEVFPAWEARGLLLAWAATKDENTRAVGLYDATSGKLIADERLSADTVRKGVELAVSANGTMAAAGPMLVDVTAGTSQVVRGWSTMTVNGAGIFGTRNGERLVWTGKGDPEPVEQTAALPWGTTEDGALAVVADRSDAGQTIIGAIRAH